MQTCSLRVVVAKVFSQKTGCHWSRLNEFVAKEEAKVDAEESGRGGFRLIQIKAVSWRVGAFLINLLGKCLGYNKLFWTMEMRLLGIFTLSKTKRSRKFPLVESNLGTFVGDSQRETFSTQKAAESLKEALVNRAGIQEELEVPR